MNDAWRKYTLTDYATIKEAIEAITRNLTRCVIVVDAQDIVVGVLSEGDILRALMEDISLFAPVRAILSPAFCFSRERNVEEGLRLLKDKGVTLLPIVDQHFRLQDVVTIQDILTSTTLST